MSTQPKVRARLSSVGDSSVPPSDSSEGSGSETFENSHEWTGQAQLHPNDIILNADLEMHSLSPENSGILNDVERAQIESFFSGLGTEVGVTLFSLSFSGFLISNFSIFCLSALKLVSECSKKIIRYFVEISINIPNLDMGGDQLKHLT